MRETSLVADAKMAIDRVRNITAGSVPSAAVPSLRFSFSAGVARHLDGQSIDQTTECADAALYAAKHAGRSCTVIGGVPSAPACSTSGMG